MKAVQPDPLQQRQKVLRANTPSAVPLLAWGCANWSLVDYSTPEGRMWGCSPKTSLWPNASAVGWTDETTFRGRPPVRTAWIAETAALPWGRMGPLSKII
ncbi:hypothetical protein GCM10010276_38760 [Streptomyces longisporus]|uniref:Uncharacterized protein n=1 Tax=Streptomyces longisporus TaxID=1948 RepID=A0ABP5ZC21_STRLO